MDIKSIREMTDEQLENFLKSITIKAQKNCCICGLKSTKIIKINDKEKFQTKKLCSICDNCYKNMIDNYLKVSDIEW